MPAKLKWVWKLKLKQLKPLLLEMAPNVGSISTANKYCLSGINFVLPQEKKLINIGNSPQIYVIS